MVEQTTGPKGSYVYDYVIEAADAPKRHLRTLMSVQTEVLPTPPYPTLPHPTPPYPTPPHPTPPYPTRPHPYPTHSPFFPYVTPHSCVSNRILSHPASPLPHSQPVLPVCHTAFLRI